jgi:hypothetical protein
MKRPQDVTRIVLAMMLGLGGVANSIMVMTNPALYQHFADLSLFGFYVTLWSEIVLPNLQLMIGLVVAVELGAAILLLRKGILVKLGAIIGVGFMAMLVPFWWSGFGLMNLGLAGIFVWILFSEYPTSIVKWPFVTKRDGR